MVKNIYGKRKAIENSIDVFAKKVKCDNGYINNLYAKTTGGNINVYNSLSLDTSSNQLLIQPGGSGNKFTLTASTPGQNTTLTLPDPASVSDTFALLTATQNLQNKSLFDTNCQIVNGTDHTKILAFSLLGANPGTFTQLFFNQTANRAINFPDATDTLVALSTSDLLQNKKLYDLNNTIVSQADITKQFGWSLGGATTGTKTTLVASQTTNRSLTLPDVTDTLVARSTADTFSGVKTFSVQPVFTAANNQIAIQPSGSGNKYTITAANPGQNTSLSIVDPGTASDNFVLASATQTLSSKSVIFPTSGGTAATLSYYEEYSWGGNFSGALTSGSATVYIYRIGKICHLYWGGVSQAANAASSLTIAGPGVFPTRLQPVANANGAIAEYIFGGDNGTGVRIMAQLNTTTFQIQCFLSNNSGNETASFSGLGTLAVKAVHMTWVTA